MESPVAYMSFIENILVVSWENGMFNIYSTDNLDYSIQLALEQNKTKSDTDAFENELCFVDFNMNKVFS